MTTELTTDQQLQLKEEVKKSTESTTTSWSSGITGIIVFIIVLATIAITIYIIQSMSFPASPLSRFKYGDIVTIRPAIPTKRDGNEYLMALHNDTYTTPDVALQGVSMGADASALRFIGTGKEFQSQWVLEQFDSTQTYDASASIGAGLGNRFYMRVRSNPNNKEISARIRFQLRNETERGFCYATTPLVIGSNVFGPTAQNWFNTEFLAYFMPSGTPDLYWILFPSCGCTSGHAYCSARLARNGLPNLANESNSGIISIRPWAPIPQYNTYQNNALNCTYCTESQAGTYNPHQTPTTLYDNIALTNSTGPLSPPYNAPSLPPFPNANTYLFEIKTVAV